MRIAFEKFDHPVVRGGLQPITELTGICVFALIPGALNQFVKESERGCPHEIALTGCEFLPVCCARYQQGRADRKP
jgi:hypothetical protein